MYFQRWPRLEDGIGICRAYYGYDDPLDVNFSIPRQHPAHGPQGLPPQRDERARAAPPTCMVPGWRASRPGDKPSTIPLRLGLEAIPHAHRAAAGHPAPTARRRMTRAAAARKPARRGCCGFESAATCPARQDGPKPPGARPAVAGRCPAGVLSRPLRRSVYEHHRYVSAGWQGRPGDGVERPAPGAGWARAWPSAYRRGRGNCDETKAAVEAMGRRFLPSMTCSRLTCPPCGL